MSRQPVFTGACTAIVTPFSDSGAINYDAFGRLIDEQIQQVTRDHSLVAEMVLTGELTNEEARVHRDRNIITRAVGVVDHVQADIYEHKLQEGSRVLMCTDGLSNMLADDEILSIVKSQRDIVETVERLIQAANDNGGTDNITAIVIEP